MKLFTFFLLLFIVSCIPQKKDYESAIIIETENKPNGQIAFDSVTMVPIESSNDRLLSDILRVQFDKSGIYVADLKNHKCVFRYDYNGNFLNKIGNRGYGPNEYLGFSNFLIDADTIELMTGIGATTRILKYDLSGGLLKDTEYNIVASAFDKIKSTYLFSTSYGNITYKHRLVQLDQKGNLLNSYLQNDTKITIPVEEEKFSKHKGVSYYRESFDNKVYAISENGIEVKYSLDFGKHSIPKKFYETEVYMAIDDLNKRGFMALNSYFENDNYSVFCYIFQKENHLGESYQVLYDKNSKKTYKAKYTEEGKKCFNNLVGLTQNNELIFLQNALNVVTEREDLLKLNIQNKNQLTGIKETDNPVFFFCKIRDNK